MNICVGGIASILVRSSTEICRELRRGWGPKEKDELMEWRGPGGWVALFVRDPDGEGARGIAKPVGGVAAIAWRFF